MKWIYRHSVFLADIGSYVNGEGRRFLDPINLRGNLIIIQMQIKCLKIGES